MWTLEDVRKIQDRIRWDLTPEAAAKARATSRFRNNEDHDVANAAHRGYFFCIDVWGCKTSLVIMENQGHDGVVHILQTNIPDRLLEEAVFEAGGALIVSGYYPLSDKIEAWIRERL